MGKFRPNLALGLLVAFATTPALAEYPGLAFSAMALSMGGGEAANAKFAEAMKKGDKEEAAKALLTKQAMDQAAQGNQAAGQACGGGQGGGQGGSGGLPPMPPPSSGDSGDNSKKDNQQAKASPTAAPVQTPPPVQQANALPTNNNDSANSAAQAAIDQQTEALATAKKDAKDASDAFAARQAADQAKDQQAYVDQLNALADAKAAQQAASQKAGFQDPSAATSAQTSSNATQVASAPSTRTNADLLHGHSASRGAMDSYDRAIRTAGSRSLTSASLEPTEEEQVADVTRLRKASTRAAMAVSVTAPIAAVPSAQVVSMESLLRARRAK